MLRRSLFAAALASLLGSLSATTALAQDAGRSRATRSSSIVPAPGGSGTGDTIARVLAEELQARLKTSIVIDNKAGANGNIGATAAAGDARATATTSCSAGPARSP